MSVIKPLIYFRIKFNFIRDILGANQFLTFENISYLNKYFKNIFDL